MSFEQMVRVPKERVGVIIGRSGEEKKELEETLKVRLDIDSETGDVTIRADAADLEEVDPFKAMEVIDAIGKGFSPERAKRLLKEEQTFTIIDLRETTGRSKSSLERIKGRIIGERGKARRIIEELTGASISVYGHYVSIICDEAHAKLASDAVSMLAGGSEHRTVYEILQKARTKEKLDRLKLWED
ncbi:MAG TPA: KH domain-containing protein [Conexivisphaerales archaeon]|nr:KH domain-containing protein [Conexivisphaerales archaeon]